MSFRRACAAPVLLLLALAAALPAHAAARAPVRSERGMVVTSEPGATRAGVAMLERGGNAVDAAVAAAFALGVTQPFSAGLGGGAFLLIRLPDGRVIALDARETAPAAATADMYLRPGVPEGASLFGPLAIATPGFVAGCALALERWGTLTLAEALAPAIALAEDGVEIGRYHARMLQFVRARGLAERFPETARIQLPQGAIHPGWRLRQPDLAATLRRIAAGGAEVFYRGEIARQIASHLAGQGGLLGEADLAAYQPVVREPVRGSYRGYTVHAFPPPSSGVTLIEILNVLEASELGVLGAGSSAAIHRAAEAMKLAFADRNTFLGDGDFVEVPVAELVSKDYAAWLHARIDPPWWRRAPWLWLAGERALRVRAPGLPQDDSGTTHLSTSDARGGAVALTMTINTPFGSGITVPGTGIVLNNEMDDFSRAPGLPNAYGLIDTRGANAIAPGKRPLSSMTPTILEEEGRLFLVTGSPGGPRIITTTALAISNVIDFGMDVSEAVSAPRFHHQWQPDVLRVEPAVPDDVVENLRARGHTVEVSDRNWSAAESITVDAHGVHRGAADPRRDGLALGP